MNIGDTLDAALWIDGRETAEQRRRFEIDVSAALAEGQEEHGVIIGPVIWTEKKPGEERVPPVPDHIQGPDVRLLVGTAKVIAFMPVFGESRFYDDLEPDDQERLRRITRKAYKRDFPGYPRLTDRQCETLINDLGPEAGLDALRANDTDIRKVLN